MELFNKSGVVVDQGTKDLENMIYKMVAQHVEHLIRNDVPPVELVAFSTYITNSVSYAVSTNMLQDSIKQARKNREKLKAKNVQS